MASVKKGTLTPPPQWWRHLRDWKRVYWKKERKAASLALLSEKQAEQPITRQNGENADDQ